MVEGIVYTLRCGQPWRDLPRRFGPWQTVYGWFRRWCVEGLWSRAFRRVASRPDGRLRMVDGSYIRVHQDGAPHTQLADDEGVGTSRGGRSTKIHALVDVRGRPVKLLITPGNHHDLRAAPELVGNLSSGTVVADKGYDSIVFRNLVHASGCRSCIPTRNGAKTPQPFNAGHYRRRHQVENFFARIKRYRRIATRYDRSRSSFEGMLMISAILDWIR